ncbi:MAG: hypothetical protein ABWY93_27440 [Mycobacterium sp.]
MGINHAKALQVLSAATIVAAFGVSGCSDGSSGSTAASSAPTAAEAPAQPGALPQPQALTDVLGRLADPAVTGVDKLPLVEGATAAEAADLDKFAKALQDNRMLPLTFAATDMVWSPDVPGNVTTTVTMTPADASLNAFSYPMEFKPAIGGWQLSRKTADLLLAFGTPTPGAPAPATPTPTP